MGKLSNKIANSLNDAIKDAAEVIIDDSGSVSSDVESLLNSGVEANKKRRNQKEKPTQNKAEQKTDDNSLFSALIPQEESSKEKEKYPKTYEEVCEHEIHQAHERNLPEPDFDFRTMFEKSDRKWFVRILEPLGEKELLHVKIRTVYPRMLIAVEEKTPLCHCIGYNMRNQIFDTEYEARNFFDTVKVSKKYYVEPIKKEYDYEEEDDDMSVSEEEYNKLMKEGDNNE